jgi:uncharacterized membrane protein
MDSPFYMDAVITPHRSLSSRGFIVLIGVMTTINACSAGLFLYMGAGPVPIFLGLDLLAVIVAFAVSQRAAERRECIQVTAAEVRVTLCSRKGEQMIWCSPTASTRLALVGQAGEEDDLRLRLSDRELRVARDLSRPERLAFAKALDRALWRARRGSRMAGAARPLASS